MDLLERAQYLDQLEELLHLAMKGQGRMVLVSGEAGIGKTVLVEQFLHEHSSAFRLLWGACEALFTPHPLGPLLDIASQVRGCLSTLIRHDTERSTLFSALLEELQQPPLPTVLVFEDVHWADEATLDLLKFLGRRILHLPTLFIVTCRENELGREHPLRSVVGDLPIDAVTRIRLTSLSEQAVAHLARQAHREADQLYAVTGGNPFFVTEVLASNVPGVPPTVRDAVVARMARLSPTARTLLELASVVPARIERWLLETILETSEETLEECLISGMLCLEGMTVAFRHELARQAIESTLSPLRRQTLHQQVIQTMLAHGENAYQAARLVHHALGAHDGTLVARYAPLAARQASAQGAHREAAAHYATALLEIDRFSPEHQAELLEGRSYECYLINQIEDAVQARQAALKIWQELGRGDQVGQTLRWLSRLNWSLGKPGEAKRYAAEAVNLLETFPPDTNLAMAYSNQAQLFMLTNDTAEAVHWGERAMALAGSLRDTETLIHALNNLGAAQFVAQPEQGRAHLEHSLQLALEGGWEEHVARAYANLAGCAIKIHDYPLAEHFLQKGLAYCARHDLDAWETDMIIWQARSKFEQGYWDEAASEVTRVIGHYGLPTMLKIPALALLGGLRVRRGDPGSIPVLNEARTLALSTGGLQQIVPVAAVCAEAAWLGGNLEQCLKELRVGYNLALVQTDPWSLGQLSVWMWRAGGLKQAEGAIAEPYARQIAGDWRGAAAMWEQLGCPYEQALALTSGDTPAQQQALDLFEQLGAQPAATLVRQCIRPQSVAGRPRGPYLATRSNQAGLTSRQLEVLRLMAEGFSNAEIATRLFTSPKTVDHHVSAVLAKLAVRSRTQAIRVAYQMELFTNKTQFST